ncbi:MAG: hypothetical protein AB7I42_25850 [Bradyrhizobium sp.]|uniref:hypothetical protein n=1 Tax=Bradyrhizobium sp. TaxID=376 RepID=UPI003D11C4CD
MTGLDLDQLREWVIRPVLAHLGSTSRALEQLLLGTAIQESRGQYLKQLKGGPAVGLYQMEPATHDDIWRNYLAYHQALATRVRMLDLQMWYENSAEEMAGNLYYATAMCAVHYLRRASIKYTRGDIREARWPLPPADDIAAQARYYKRWYNTPQGRGSEAEYVQNWREAGLAA